MKSGITQHAQTAVGGTSVFTFDTETAEEIKRYWRQHGLQEFWWGSGFHLHGKGQEASYRLAQVLFHLLTVDHRRELPDFIRQANVADAGDSAARQGLGKAQFFGKGEWEPRPPDASALCRRGAYYSSAGQDDRAVADFGEALRLDPRSAGALTSRGYAYSRLRQFRLARADYEKALEIDPDDFVAHNNLAWLLATCAEDQYRDGARAIEHANRACELSDSDAWYCLGTLAAAYAEGGDFEEAIHWARESLRGAPERERAACRERVKLYKEGRPYRELAKLLPG